MFKPIADPLRRNQDRPTPRNCCADAPSSVIGRPSATAVRQCGHTKELKSWQDRLTFAPGAPHFRSVRLNSRATCAEEWRQSSNLNGDNKVPDLDWNIQTWQESYDWEKGGEEWSETWGGSRAQWFGSIFPRISRWLPCNSILEIAPGFGRMTKYLREHALQDFCGVDVSARCVEACASRFDQGTKSRFIVNDGLDLGMIPDNSIDFIFSFDSLVHAEIDVLGAYIPQAIKKLTPDGAAFIHHSNAANHRDPENPDLHSRAQSVSSDSVLDLIQAGGGHVLIQEEINWGGQFRIDCFTTFCKSESAFRSKSIKIQNNSFVDESLIIKQFQAPYHGI
jgi:hypothetical protein